MWKQTLPVPDCQTHVILIKETKTPYFQTPLVDWVEFFPAASAGVLYSQWNELLKQKQWEGLLRTAVPDLSHLEPITKHQYIDWSKCLSVLLCKHTDASVVHVLSAWILSGFKSSIHLIMALAFWAKDQLACFVCFIQKEGKKERKKERKRKNIIMIYFCFAVWLTRVKGCARKGQICLIFYWLSAILEM